MHMRLSPALKGVITALLMIGTSLGVYYSGLPADSFVQFLIYIIYALGIIWTLFVFRKSTSFTGKFVALFSQGFRCFIVVTLMMVLFTFVFGKMHPEFAEQSAVTYREHLVKENKMMLTPQIDEETALYKKSYSTILVFGAIFGYLIIGAGVTAAASALLTRRK